MPAAGTALRAPGHLQLQQELGLAELPVPSGAQSQILPLTGLEKTYGDPPVIPEIPAVPRQGHLEQ